MNLFSSKYYPKLMYLALIIVSLLIVFNMASIMDNAKIKHEKNSITGFATNTDITNNHAENITKIPNSQEPVLYSTKSYVFYYILLIGIIAGIFITFSVLRSTIIKNIEIEDQQRKL